MNEEALNAIEEKKNMYVRLLELEEYKNILERRLEYLKKDLHALKAENTLLRKEIVHIKNKSMKTFLVLLFFVIFSIGAQVVFFSTKLDEFRREIVTEIQKTNQIDLEIANYLKVNYPDVYKILEQRITGSGSLEEQGP